MAFKIGDVVRASDYQIEAYYARPHHRATHWKLRQAIEDELEDKLAQVGVITDVDRNGVEVFWIRDRRVQAWRRSPRRSWFISSCVPYMVTKVE